MLILYQLRGTLVTIVFEDGYEMWLLVKLVEYNNTLDPGDRAGLIY
jgi:hypothetical protein